jgi:hypothetical protein
MRSPSDQKVRWWLGLVAAIWLFALTGATVQRGSAQPSSHVYDAASTASCLYARPDALDVLPPASSPSRRFLYVYVAPPDRNYPPGSQRIWVWYGSGRAETLQGARLTFLPNNAAARQYNTRYEYGKGQLDRNMVFRWDYNNHTVGPLSRIVRRCLQTRRRDRGDIDPTRRPVPMAKLSTFTGHWGGHTRRILISPSGRALEYVDDGCCHFVIAVSFRLLHVEGTLKSATATFRVTAVKRGEWDQKRRPQVGQIGRLVLKNGIVTEMLTGIYYCSDPAWGATGACGA